MSCICTEINTKMVNSLLAIKCLCFNPKDRNMIKHVIHNRLSLEYALECWHKNWKLNICKPLFIPLLHHSAYNVSISIWEFSVFCNWIATLLLKFRVTGATKHRTRVLTRAAIVGFYVCTCVSITGRALVLCPKLRIWKLKEPCETPDSI